MMQVLLSMVVLIVVTAVTVRWVFGTRAQRPWGVAGEDPQGMAALKAQLSALQGQVSELAERLDFAERMLAEGQERKLGAGQ